MRADLPGDVLQAFRETLDVTALKMERNVGWGNSGQMVHNLESISKKNAPPWRLRDFPRERLEDLIRAYPTSLQPGSKSRRNFEDALDRLALYRGFGEQALEEGWYPPGLRYELRKDEIEASIIGALSHLMQSGSPMSAVLRGSVADEYRTAFQIMVATCEAILRMMNSLPRSDGALDPSTVDIRTDSLEANRREAIKAVYQIVPMVLESLHVGTETAPPPDLTPASK